MKSHFALTDDFKQSEESLCEALSRSSRHLCDFAMSFILGIHHPLPIVENIALELLSVFVDHIKLGIRLALRALLSLQQSLQLLHLCPCILEVKEKSRIPYLFFHLRKSSIQSSVSIAQTLE